MRNYNVIFSCVFREFCGFLYRFIGGKNKDIYCSFFWDSKELVLFRCLFLEEW